MELFINGTTVDVVGNVETNEEKNRLLTSIRALCDQGVPALQVNFRNTNSMNSSMIGSLVKVRIIDKVNISVGVTDDKIFKLMKYMGMDDILNVHMIILD